MEDERQPNEANSAGAKKRSSAGKNTDGKKKKRRKKDAKKRKPRIMTSQEAAVLVPQALLPLVESSFLDTKDLGRFLLRTNKAMTTAGLGENQDTIWKPLYASYWGANKADTLLETLAPMSPKSCFRQLAAMDDKLMFEGPRPLQYTPQDYVFIISIKEHETGKPILCKTIPGQDLSQFFENGKVKISFTEPLWEKNLERGYPRLRLKWDGTLHILRRPDRRLQRFMKYQGSVDQVQPTSYNPFQNTYSRQFRSSVMTRYGNAFFEHYGCYDEKLGGFEVDFRIEWRKIGTDSVGIYGFDISSHVFQMPWKEEKSHGIYCKFSNAMKGRNVTAAHFIEAMMD